MANGSDTVNVAASAVSLRMPTPLVSGAAFAITVQIEPIGQTCSITIGSGTIGTADVANAVVVCSAQSFSLGGTVTGVTNSGLVLANGSDTVTVAANASAFTLPTPVALGSSYALKVQAQPAGLA